jgi:CRISPR-associated protein Csm4
MKLLKTTITPISNFATAFYGDTIFGQLCWAIRYKFGNDRLNELLDSYDDTPFLIVSDGFASGYLPKPNMPTVLLGEKNNEKKQNRKKVWLTLKELQNGEFNKAKTSKEINFSQKEGSIIKNSINYKTSHTGEGFDPYAENEFYTSSQDIYFLIDINKLSLKELKEVFFVLSQWGYGKNSTIGKGRFKFSNFSEVKLLKTSSTSYIGLSNASLKDIKTKEFFYMPFVRFGKHGGDLATKSPFKKPLLLAGSGFVLVYEDKKELQFVGEAIKGHSKHKETIHQGYSIVIPIKELDL